METKTESISVIYQDGKVIGFVHRDPKTGHKLIYKASLMGMEEITNLLNPPEKSL